MLMACAGLWSAGLAAAEKRADYYVSPTGNDAWSGKLPEANATKTDGPLATLQAARDAIRRSRGAGNAPMMVLVRGGRHELSQALTFGPEDSNVTYAAYPGEKPVISGGRLITGWTRGEGALWTAKVEGRFNQLFADGRRQPRARHPNEGYLRTAGPIEPLGDREKARRDASKKIGFRYRPGDIRRWSNLEEVNVVVYHAWTASVHWIASLDEENHVVRFTSPSGWPMGWWESQQRYHLENLREALDAPGEWYLDPKTGILTWWPPQGIDPNKVQVVAPRLRQLVVFGGEPAAGKFVENVNLKGLSFQNAEWMIKDRGLADGQSAISFTVGAIHAIGARNCTIEDCEIAHVGEYAIWLGQGCADNAVRRCHIHDLGAGGVCIGDSRRSTTDAQLAAGLDARNNVVDNNFIHDGGHAFLAGVGVWIGQSSGNRVTHNEICDFYYTGISVGWTWGYGTSGARDNKLEYNHIHNLGKGVLSDLGGIYSLGISPGTTERYNLIHDIYSYDYGGWGLYTDEGSTGILLENNVVYNTKTGGFHQHYGRENIVRNNIFAFSMEEQIKRTRTEPHTSFFFERNIVVGDHDAMLGSNWRDDNFRMDYNLYWNTAGDGVDFFGNDLAGWQARGHDRNSIVADPMFVDAKSRDLRLKDGSPALKLGFKPIDMSRIGLYGEKEWVDAPKKIMRGPITMPPPRKSLRSIDEDFEAVEPGRHPSLVRISGEEKTARIAVTEETAAGGKRSLKIVDAADLSHTWQPHFYYEPRLNGGTAKMSFDLRVEPGAIISHEWRDSASPYNVGPSLSIGADGSLKAGQQALLKLPHGQWVKFEITCPLGSAAGTYDLRVTAPGQPPRSFEKLPTGKNWKALRWLGFTSAANASTVFYLDNVKLDAAP